MPNTREQRYAAGVYEHITQVARLTEDQRKKYGSLAHKLPVLIRTAGLAQALAFVDARQEEMPRLLLRDLAAVLGQPDLLAQSRTAPLGSYMRLTQEALEALLWFKRYAQSVLGVEASQEDNR